MTTETTELQSTGQPNEVKIDAVYKPDQIDDPQRDASKWQKSLFLIGFVFLLFVFGTFVVTSIINISKVQDSISGAPILSDSTIIHLYRELGTVPIAESASFMLLENQMVKKRYHNANVILNAQIYIKFLGFITGMIISVIGALFVLGKYREYPVHTNISGSKIPVNIMLQTTSPGIILCLIGSAIMLSSIFHSPAHYVKDEAIFFKYIVPVSSPTDTSNTNVGSSDITKSSAGVISQKEFVERYTRAKDSVQNTFNPKP
jgi:hypothetical protein